MNYKFYDTNIYGDCNEEYDICKDEYRDFLSVCFKYSAFFTIRVWHKAKESDVLMTLEKYRVPVDDRFLEYYGVYDGAHNEIRCYKLCPEIYELISGLYDSLFSWQLGQVDTDFEDPAFFREDGSVFFYSVIHEGHCQLSVKDGEDVANVVNNKYWYLSKPLINEFALSCDNGHRLICKDWFYTYSNQASVSSYVTDYCVNDRYIGAKRIPYTSECDAAELLAKAGNTEYYIIDTVENEYNGKLYGPYTKEKYEDQLTKLETGPMGEWVSAISRPDGLFDRFEQF